MGCIWCVYIATASKVSLDNSHPFSSIADHWSGEAPSYWHIYRIEADAWKTEWFRGKWEMFWRIHFIVFAVDGQRSVTKACKYMIHSGFMSPIYSLTEQLSSKCQCRDTLIMPSTQADLSFWKSFPALCLVAWDHFNLRCVISGWLHESWASQIWCRRSEHWLYRAWIHQHRCSVSICTDVPSQHLLWLQNTASL